MTDTAPPSRYIFFTDPTFWAVVGGNVFAMIMAQTQNWSFTEMVWTYWVQSVTIGIINVYRMRSLKEFSVTGIRMSDRPMREDVATRNYITGFFMLHYGIFHFGYLVFLINDVPLKGMGSGAVISMILGMMGFIATHIYSFRQNRLLDFRDKKPNIGSLMLYPYMRILPMHLVIMLGMSPDGGNMLFFMAMKMVADAGMHIVEHKIFRKS